LQNSFGKFYMIGFIFNFQSSLRSRNIDEKFDVSEWPDHHATPR
jgi:hypothetical protein